MHVTEVLRLCGAIPEGPWYTEQALARGSAIHRATALDDEHDLDEATVDPAILPRLEQWRKFRRECDVEVFEIEQQMTDTRLAYCGTPDRIGTVNGQLSILDLKPAAERWHSIQLAGYVLLYGRPARRWTLVLPADGSDYKLIPHQDRRDLAVFRAMLTTAQWLKNGG